MKILLNLFTNDMREEDFTKLSQPFESEEYAIFNFQFSLSEYYLEIIDTVLNYLCTEENIFPYKSKIVLQSNVSNLMIAWYRLYNDVIDDFVIINHNMVSFTSNSSVEKLFVDQLTSFSALEQEKCHSRLYYRYSEPIIPTFLELFIKNYQYNLLKPFEELMLNEFFEKRKIEKEYRFKNQRYRRESAGEYVDRVIDLNKRREFQNNIQINEIAHPAGYFFTFHYIINLSPSDIQQAEAALMLKQKMSVKDQKKVTEYTLNYLSVARSKLPFQQVVNFYTFLILLGVNKSIIKELFNYLKEDHNHIDYYYVLLTNILFFISKSGQEEHECYFQDRVEIMRKLKSYYRDSEKIKYERLDNHLVIVVGQLLGYNHAPTKIAIDYANYLVKYDPGIKIKIIVEDMFNYSPNELFFVNRYSSANSANLSDNHKCLLHPSIEVYYSDSDLFRKQRLKNDIKAITSFKPQWILKIGAPDSLVVDQLYDYYPVTSFSMAGAEYSEFIDIAFSGRTVEKVLLERTKKGVSNGTYQYYQHNPGLEFKERENVIDRKSYNLKQSDFIIVTVGNRLDVEMDELFIMGMKEILSNNTNVKWLIVGLEQHKLISLNFGRHIEQVKFIKYAQNLMDIYFICDMYANPFRSGGGISVAMAMHAKLPIANEEGANDANVYIPNGKAQNRSDYFDYIVRLTKDRNFYVRERDIFHQTIEKRFGFESAVRHVRELLAKSEKNFIKRKI
ncbi:hypothetical protein [Metabacillus fastidiosus]|uniref:hypothetical protein n=1 Tax=Metabacillus fastidiosus TaxID=1458 RepID=UPI002DBE7812|nr:hypothetical protein [Metabacillus fastidiosus]MEC2077308.1 hypothetical protein [Metabacillus fastidiosus]